MSSRPASRSPFWIAAMLGLAGAWALYRSALGFEFLSYDDLFYVRDNAMVNRGFSAASISWAWSANLYNIERLSEYWMPLTLLSRMLDGQLFPGDGGWHHLQGILLHGLNAALLFQLLAVSTRSTGRSAAIALLYLVHPLCTEVVCWIALRKDVLAATFSLLTLLLYVRFTQNRTWKRFLLALAAYTCALASKPSSISLPLALLLFDGWPLNRLDFRRPGNRGNLEVLAEKIPFVLLAVIVAALTYVGQHDAGSGSSVWEYNFLQKVQATVVGMLEYLQRAVLPHSLCVLYPQRDPALLATSTIATAVFTLVALTLAFGVFAWRGRGAGLMGWIWFLGLLVPVSGLVQFGRQATADRYMYLPLIGVLIAVVWLVADALAALPARRGRLIPVVLTALAAALLAGQSYRQAQTWRNGITLWEHAALVEPDHAFAFQILGGEFFTANAPAVGENHLRVALKMTPDSGELLAKTGVLLAKHDKPALALGFLDRAIRQFPRDLRLHQAMIESFRKLGRMDRANKAEVRMQLVRLDAFVRTGLDFAKNGEGGLAREQFSLAWSAASDARQLEPDGHFFRSDTPFWDLSRQLLAAQGTRLSAFEVASLTAALRYFTDGPRAVAEFEALTRQFPDEAEAWWRLALCRLELRENAAANAAAERARAAARPSADAENEWKRAARRTAPGSSSGPLSPERKEIPSGSEPLPALSNAPFCRVESVPI